MAAAVLENKPNLFPVSRQLNGLSVHPAIRDSELLDEAVFLTPSLPVDQLSAWRRVDSELKAFESEHHRFWWNRGKSLAVLLHSAGYSPDLQYRDLKFYAQVIAPHLGISHDVPGGGTSWPSFMTDDGNPVELSWDWGTGDKPPTVRYSMEPIGVDAGTPLDPRNLLAAPSLHNQLIQTLPDVRQEWHNHFLAFFNSRTGAQDASDHNSTLFYAFDLSPAEVTAKSYFFPKFRARLEGRSPLSVLSSAILSAPHAGPSDLRAWTLFEAFAASRPSLEHEMLAIDLIDPLSSRLKIYFRSRDTGPASVRDVMTLGGRIASPGLERGLDELEALWRAVFGTGDDGVLPDRGHRTAGILYNVEFRLGDRVPVAKVYMPVRHYARSDKGVMDGLAGFLGERGRGRYVGDYVRMMEGLFSADALRARAGVQTYVGASIRADGSLRVVSYFKSDIAEIRSGV